MVGLSTGSSWAVLSLASLASSSDRVLARDLAEGLGAPLPYLSKILHRLSLAGLVDTKRGIGGGYRLLGSAEKITVAQIAGLIEGEDWLSECLLGSALCSDSRACPAHEFWKVERREIMRTLEGLTIKAVAEFQEAKDRKLSGDHPKQAT